jgi:hypothetical protein
MKTDELDALIKISQEIQISEPVRVSQEEAERIWRENEAKRRKEIDDAKFNDGVRRARLAKEYAKKHPFSYNPYAPSILAPIDRALDGVSSAVGRGAMKAFDAAAGAAKGFGKWFKGTLDKPDATQPGQPRFLGR